MKLFFSKLAVFSLVKPKRTYTAKIFSLSWLSFQKHFVLLLYFLLDEYPVSSSSYHSVAKGISKYQNICKTELLSYKSKHTFEKEKASNAVILPNDVKISQNLINHSDF